MTWQRGPCQLPNSDTAEHCRNCQKHWRHVWHQSKRRRNGSHSRPRQEVADKSDKKDKTTKKDPVNPSKTPIKEKEQDAWQVFPTRVPWVATTPQSRIPRVQEQEQSEDKPLPPNPVLPAPPASRTVVATPSDTLTESEAETLKHLKALKDLGSLPEMLVTQLQELEKRQSLAVSQRTLNHGHLNRLHRVRNQVQSTVKKIVAVDEDWRNFISEVTSKVHMHAHQFQAHRGDLLETLNTKLQELETIKLEVSTASQQLMGQTPVIDTQLEDMNLQEQLAQFHQMTAAMGVTDTPLVEVSEEEPEQTEELDEEMEAATPGSDKPSKVKSHLAPAPFRQPGSPGKVASHHLKGKEQDKEKRRDKERDKSRSASAYREDPL
eukprot:Skav214675  [mRNA]  locus=scaffold923:540234:541367:- [translate_table: standard]